MYYEEEYYGKECNQCVLHDVTIEDVKYWFTGILDQLYSTAKLDRNDLEHCLEELGHLIGLSVPASQLKVERSQEPKLIPIQKTDEVESWKGWNAEYLKQLALI